MTPRLQRIGAAASAATATSVPVVRPLNHDGADSGLLEAERLVLALIDYVEGSDLFDDEMDRIGSLIWELEKLIADEPARTIAGVAVKLRRLSYLSGTENGTNGATLEPELLTSARALVERFAAGERS